MKLRRTREKTGWYVEALEEGRSVSRLWIVDRQMRIGASSVRVGGIGGVGTDSAFRRRGLARQVLEETVRLLDEESYDGAFLFGIQDFYHRFGFVTCMPEWRLYLETRAAEKAPKRLAMRPLRVADLPAVMRIYNRENTRRTGSVVRRSGAWTGFSMGSQFGVGAVTRVVMDAQGRVVGYVVYDDTTQHVRAAEVGGQREDVHETILHHLAQRAIRLRRQELSFSVPPDHPFARFCRPFGSRESTEYNRNGGPMGRIIRLESFVGKILGELESRWGAEDHHYQLVLRTDLGACRVGWKNDGLQMGLEGTGGTQIRLQQEALMLLMMGYRTAGDLLCGGQLHAPRPTWNLLERLFPQQQAHMWWPDRF